MALFKYRFVLAMQQTVDLEGANPRKVWRVATVDGKQDSATGEDLYEYSNKLGQETWDLISDSVNGSARELVFRYSIV